MIKSNKIFDVVLFNTLIKKYIEYKWYYSMKLLWVHDKNKVVSWRYIRRDHRIYTGRQRNSDFINYYHNCIRIKVYWVYDFFGYYKSGIDLLDFNNFFYKKGYKTISLLNWPFFLNNKNPRNKKQLKVAKYSIFRNYIGGFLLFGGGAKYYENKLKIEFLLYTKSIMPINPKELSEELSEFTSIISLRRKTFNYILKYGYKYKKYNFLNNIDFQYILYDNSVGLMLLSEFYITNYFVNDELNSNFDNFHTDDFFNIFYLYDNDDNMDNLKKIISLAEISQKINETEENTEFNNNHSNIFINPIYKFDLLIFQLWNKYFLIEFYKSISLLLLKNIFL